MNSPLSTSIPQQLETGFLDLRLLDSSHYGQKPGFWSPGTQLPQALGHRFQPVSKLCGKAIVQNGLPNPLGKPNQFRQVMNRE